MLTTHLPARSRRALLAMLAAIAAVAASSMVTLLHAPAANAAFVVSNDYNAATKMPDACIRFGQADQNGVMHLACGTKIMRWNRNGTKLADLSLTGKGLYAPLDVAPSPDGKVLYVTQGDSTPRRLTLNGNTLTVDKNWRLDKFTFWGVESTPVGHNIQTDGRGDIYVSNAARLGGHQRSIAKYAPDGTFITAFGDWGREPGNWVANQDIAVSRDGRRVYVGENCGINCIYGTEGYDGSRVTRYDFTAGGNYRFSRIISAQGPYAGRPFADCPDPGAVHSAYALSMDAWDNLYVTSVTCKRIQQFATNADPAQDKFVKTIATWTDTGTRNHIVSSDWAGRLYLSEWDRMVTPKAPKVPAVPLPALEPLPAPDVTAPTVTALTLPATTTTRQVELSVEANDDTGVAEMQLAREDGMWGPWQPFASPATYELSADYGVKGVYVRVRDMAGNESNAVYRTLGYVEPVVGADPDDPPPPVADQADPVLTTIAIPPLTPTNDIQVTIDATDDTGVRAARMANEDGNWGAWRAFDAVMDWQLSPGQGMKAVFVQVRDGSGRESGQLVARTRVQADAPPPQPPGEQPQEPDTVAPILASMAIPAETTAQRVDVTMDATDVGGGVVQVRFANEDGNWTAWQEWAATKQWQLSDGFGAKLVYAQVRDAAGNESAVLNARTTHVREEVVVGPVDAADPALTEVVLPETVDRRDVGVGLKATDDIGVTQVRFANEDGNWGAWVDFDDEVPHVLTAGNTFKVVYAQVRDAAGRESNVLFVRTRVVA